MRFLSLLALLTLAACGSQDRYDYEDPWQNYDPTVKRPTYDETYTPPSEMNADQLVERAIRAESRGRDDQARVDYHQAFRRDRWHDDANRRYQNLMLRNNLFDEVWQEYLDLWQQHPERGDAFWLHMRPMLLRREADMPLVRYKKRSEDDTQRIDELTARSATAADNHDRDGALAALDKALAIADLPALHKLRIELLHPMDYQSLLDEYAERAEENPANGDTLYLHAHVLSLRDAHGALKLLRDAWILELPGYWLRFGIAEICRQLGDDGLDSGADRGSTLGWYACAQAFTERCLKARPDDTEAAALLDWVSRQQARVR
ncbi:MAG: hypothetical protein K8I27_02725 [Planctomycetes bacterium]|nr:hypothetical protein [Planctomycetota bacterium]